MLQQLQFKKNIFSLTLFFLLKTSHSMMIDYHCNHPPGLCKDLFFLILDKNQKTIDKLPQSLTKNINLFHYTIGTEHQYDKKLNILLTFCLVSKQFFQFTTAYIKENLKKFITLQDIFHYEINTNKNPLSNKRFLPIYQTENYDVQKELFKRMQWCVFYQDLVTHFKKSSEPKSDKKPKNNYLIKASKNTLNNALGQMYYNTIKILINNKNSPIDPRLLKIYNQFTLHTNFSISAQKKPGWLDTYITSDGKEIPQLSQPSKKLYVTYDKTEQENLKWFIDKYKNFCLQHKNDILDILNHPKTLRTSFRKCHRKNLKPYFIMRFLIVLDSMENTQEKNLLCDFLTKLSMAYWYNKFNFL